jgi:hypothetical protein
MSDLRSPKLLKKTLLSLAESSNKRAGNRGAVDCGPRAGSSCRSGEY